MLRLICYSDRSLNRHASCSFVCLLITLRLKHWWASEMQLQCRLTYSDGVQTKHTSFNSRYKQQQMKGLIDTGLYEQRMTHWN